MSFYPKKALSQVFLANKGQREKIARVLSMHQGKVALEIGAGKGALTRYLLQIFSYVYALEIDPLLCRLLGKELGGCGNLKIECADFLNYNLPQLKEKAILISNLPYHLSYEFIDWLIEKRGYFEYAYVGFQKEFADKLLAVPKTKNYGFLTLKSQVYLETEKLFDISRRYFKPMPKVDTTFVRIKIRDNSLCPDKEIKGVLRFIRAGFSQRRKKITNSLKSIVPEGKLRLILQKAGINQNLRAEELSFLDFYRIFSLAKSGEK